MIKSLGQQLDIYTMLAMYKQQLIRKPLEGKGWGNSLKRVCSIRFLCWKNAKLIRKSTEVENLLFSARNKVAVEECMN